MKYLNTIPVNRLFFFVAALLLTSGLNPVFAQTTINSPYSRFGLGEFSKNRNSYFSGMAGTSLAYRSPFHINTANPASYAFFDTLSFVFEGGVYGNISRLQSDTLSLNSQYASLTGLQFGFPVTRWWKASFGLLPLSSVGYNIKIDVVDPEVGNTRFNYQGNGGLNKFYLGSGFNLGDNFSVGINGHFIFGNIEQTRYISFPDSVFYLNTQITRSTILHDLHADIGIQYFNKIGNELEAGVGGYYSFASNLSGEKSYLVQSFFGIPGSSTSFRDTIIDRGEGKGTVTLPPETGIGLSLGKKDSWLTTAEIRYKHWEKYSSFGLSDSLDNSIEIRAGAEILPEKTAIANYWKRITYRFGFHYNQTGLKINGSKVDEFGISFGFGFPIPRSLSTINTSLEFGKTGTLEHDLIRNSFFRFTLGVSIYERWFVKRKYY